MIEHLKKSIAESQKLSSKLTDEIIKIHGMSSPKVRHLLNNVCSMPNCTYLEVGTWKGSTLVSALYKNNYEHAYAIDNWSQFGEVRNDFYKSLDLIPDKTKLTIIEKDCFSVAVSEMKKCNVYFYDGNHSEESQKNAFLYFDPIFSDQFIALVDDWNDQQVRDGTNAAFTKLGYKIDYRIELPASHNGDIQNYWNGLFAAVISKPGIKTYRCNNSPVQIKSWRDIPGWFNARALYDKIARQLPEGAIAVEVGVWLGQSIAYLSEITKGKSVKIYGVDQWSGFGQHQFNRKYEVDNNFYGLFQSYMSQLGCNIETVVEHSTTAAEKFNNESIDFVFIDASHDYWSVKADIEAWWPKVKPGGYLAGDDYGSWPGVTRAVDEFGKQTQVIGVGWLIQKPPSA